VLVRMHADILPHLAGPHLLADWLTRAVDAGGLPGMLALHAIFALVTAHGLEYPRFYARLYSLLTPAALMVRPSPLLFIMQGQHPAFFWGRGSASAASPICVRLLA
jgi:U3 small nucleolar RNA-associated protein 19